VIILILSPLSTHSMPALPTLQTGFRSRVFDLLQRQDVLSVDQAYTIPVGTEFKYTSSCRFDSVSEEISSESDYSSSLSSEADMNSSSSSSSSSTSTKSESYSFGFSAIFPVKGLFASLGLNVEGGNTESTTSSQSQSQAFSKSQKFDSFRSTSRADSVSQTRTFIHYFAGLLGKWCTCFLLTRTLIFFVSNRQTVSFEAKAVCSEFEVMFKPYAEKTLDPLFVTALDELPVPYEAENPEHRIIYGKFIATYGTHYTSKVVLGAKRILTTTMSSQSVAELNRESVDISSTLSVQMQVKL